MLRSLLFSFLLLFTIQTTTAQSIHSPSVDLEIVDKIKAEGIDNSQIMDFMETMRILKAIDVQPRRTIRIALWDGEEQGLHGSREYVTDQFATRDQDWGSGGDLTKHPDYDNFSAYYNIDNGTGQVRGIYL